MRNIKQFSAGVSLLVFMMILSPAITMADAKKGHRLYKKKFQKNCKVAGSTFARHHTQDEWEKINENGLFKVETKKICPRIDIDELNEKQWEDIYDFTYRFGIGGEIPNGCDPK